MVEPQRLATAELLRFNPDWIKDPVDILLRVHLDREHLAKLATIHLQLQKHILEGQIRATEQALAIAMELAK